MKTNLKNKLKTMLLVGGATLGAPIASATTVNASSQTVQKETNNKLTPAIEKLLNQYGDKRVTLRIGKQTYKGRASDIKEELRGNKSAVKNDVEKVVQKEKNKVQKSPQKEANNKLTPAIEKLLNQYGDKRVTLRIGKQTYNGRASDIKEELRGNKSAAKNEVQKATQKNVDKSSVDEETKKVFELVNKERAKVGLKPLKYDAEMEKVASVRAKELEKRWSHTRPDGRPWNTAHKRLNGENLSKGYNDPERMVKAWMNSPSHRKNILHTRYNSVGMAKHVSSNGTVFWAQSFSDS